jgi:hypothetical protein
MESLALFPRHAHGCSPQRSCSNSTSLTSILIGVASLFRLLRLPLFRHHLRVLLVFHRLRLLLGLHLRPKSLLPLPFLTLEADQADVGVDVGVGVAADGLIMGVKVVLAGILTLSSTSSFHGIGRE